MGEFVQGVREEMRRTTFPSSDEVRKTTIIVVINVIFFALYLFLVDRGWAYILEGLTWLINKMAGA
ncbi:MAG: preprotein translocase subunit SecE [Acidobacteria bacterium]|jgi:preprotein translocase SecE subunit|nr:MAG: preprotein translocase subunit SecE [Acidobacteriota bacterium]